MNAKFMQFLEGKQHPFSLTTLEQYQRLSALYSSMPHVRNEELLWLVNQIDDPLVKGSLKKVLMDGLQAIHDMYSLYIAERVALLPEGAKVTKLDYERWQADVQPRVNRMWEKLKQDMKPKLFQWYRDY